MKTGNLFGGFSRSRTWLSLVAGAAALFSGHVRAADLILEINDSNPSDVIVTATGSAAATDSTNINVTDGIDLLTFFTMSIGSSPTGSFTGDLMPNGTSDSYNTWVTDDDSHANTYEDIGIYDTGGSGSVLQEFLTTAAAFTGSTAINLASYSADLPAVGATGEVMSGWSGWPGANIGSWEVVSAVPEPSSLALAGLGIGISGLLCFCRRTA